MNRLRGGDGVKRKLRVKRAGEDSPPSSALGSRIFSPIYSSPYIPLRSLFTGIDHAINFQTLRITASALTRLGGKSFCVFIPHPGRQFLKYYVYYIISPGGFQNGLAMVSSCTAPFSITRIPTNDCIFRYPSIIITTTAINRPWKRKKETKWIEIYQSQPMDFCFLRRALRLWLTATKNATVHALSRFRMLLKGAVTYIPERTIATTKSSNLSVFLPARLTFKLQKIFDVAFPEREDQIYTGL